jgi:hypothetical protein
MRWLHETLLSLVQCRRIAWGCLVLLCACAAVPQQNEWITVGHTTREAVVEAYGQPDAVMETAEGETVVYRPRNASRSTSTVEVPRVEVGPLGTVTTRTEPVVRGYGSTSAEGGLRGRPDLELRIRYDARGIVQEFIR